MPSSRPTAISNRLLDRVSRSERSRIHGDGEVLTLKAGTVLCEPGEKLNHVYFPIGGAISMVARVKARPDLEVGLIGSEGMLGATLVLGMNFAAFRGLAQSDGNVIRLTAAQYRRILPESPGLRRIVGRYLFVLLAQFAQSIVCASYHDVDARLARGLLLAHDRAGGDHFLQTQQSLSEVLGVQRSAVTIAAGKLQRQQLIHYQRGAITILSRKGLEAASCECYGAMTQRYRDVMLS